MYHQKEIDRFREIWNREAAETIRVMDSLPAGQYDFRPDTKGRSLGEMAWHLSELDACLTYGIEHDRFRFEDEPPHLKRPRELELLAPGYRLVHDEAVERIATLSDSDLDRKVTYFNGAHLTVREILWEQLLHHLIHHRAQLVLLCRMAGGTPPGLYGPNREEMRALQERMKAQ